MSDPNPEEDVTVDRFIQDLRFYDAEIRQTDYGRYEIRQWNKETLDPPVVLHIDDEQLAKYLPDGAGLENGGSYWELVAHIDEDMSSIDEVQAIVFERGRYTVLTRTGER